MSKGGAVAGGVVFTFSTHYMLPAVAAPASDGEVSSLLNREQRVRLWRQVANLGPSNHGIALISQVVYVARQVCVTAG